MLAAGLVQSRLATVARSVTTLIGTGVAGYSDQQVNNPYGLVIGPDGALYFCDLDNQRIRRLDLARVGPPPWPATGRGAGQAMGDRPSKRR